MTRLVVIVVTVLAVGFCTFCVGVAESGLNICVPNPCANGGTCSVIIGKRSNTFSCACTNGHQGVFCLQTIDEHPPTSIKPPTTPLYPSSTSVKPQSSSIKPSPTSVKPPSTTSPTPTGTPNTTAPITTSITTRTPPTPKPRPTCPPNPINLNTIGCQPAEVVFLMEYAEEDSTYDIRREGDLIRYLTMHWQGLSKDTRVGVVPYHDVAVDVIRITDADYPDKLRNMQELSKRLHPSGKADLVNALDFVRDNSFIGARDGIPKVVIAIINQLDTFRADEVLAAADRLKQGCVNVITLFVEGHPKNETLVQQIASQPHSDFYKYYDRSTDLRTDRNGFNKC